MALKAISIAPNNYPNPVETDRALVDAVGNRVSGVIFNTVGTTMAALPELLVTPTSGVHSVDVAVGTAVIREKDNPDVRGGYFVTNDAVEVVDLPVPQANPFIAAIVLRVADPQYGAVTGSVGPRIDVVSGTPATSPVAPSDAEIAAVSGTPGGWIRLSDVRINTADTGAIPAGQFTDRRTPGGFGTINCLSTNRPVVTRPGTRIHEMDKAGRERVWTGSRWAIVCNGPAMKSRRTSALTVTNNTWTAVGMSLADWDTDGMWNSAGGQTHKATIPEPGIYRATAHVTFSASTAGPSRGVGVFKSDVVERATLTPPINSASRNTPVLSSVELKLVAGDVLSIYAYQDSGADLTTVVATGYITAFEVEWLRESV